MFQRFRQWLREILNRMIGQSVVKDKLQVDVALSSVMSEAIQRWTAIYTNQASWLSEKVISLGLGAGIAREIARMATIEMGVEVTGSPRAEWLQAQYDQIAPNIRTQFEFGLAKGGLILKPYQQNGQLAVDFIQADQFYPVSFDSNGHLTAVVFVEQQQAGSVYFTKLEFHRMIPGRQCEIINKAYRSTSEHDIGSEINLVSFDAWKDLLPYAVISNVDRPLFAYYRVPMANNVETKSPLGVSCFSQAEKQIRQADELWSGLIWEFASGERAIYVDELAFGRDSENKPRLPERRLFRSVQSLGGGKAIGEGSGEDLFHDWTPEFRDEAFARGLNRIFQRIEFNCGLSYGVISDPQQIEKTATEIAAGKQRLKVTITDNQKALQAVLDHLFYAMDIYATLYNLAPAGTYEVGYDWDDSLIVDSEAQFSQDSRAVGLGAMPLWKFLERNYGLTEETAREWIAEKQKEQPADFFQDGQGA